MTPTLESALSELPAKPRVHELSKRIGISNKELLAALAERGLAIRSASASVPITVAREVIQELLGDQQAPEDGASAPAPDDGAGDPAADDGGGGAAAADGEATADSADIPGDTPGSAGHAINPLFLPPTEQPGAEPAEARSGQPQDESDGPPARSSATRRRRGRSGGGRRAAQQPDDEQATGEQATEPDQPEAIGRPTDTDRPDEAGTAAVAERVDQQHAAADGDATTGIEAVGDEQAPPGGEPDSDADEESVARGRRRRRGRRGRGRVGDSDDRPEDRSDDRTAADDSGTQADTGPVDADEPSPVTADQTESEEQEDDAEADSDSAQGGGNRRRRRRRRRSTGDETPREDDPDNTVVHVREPRLSQASSSGSVGSGTAEVQGVRGSTRLEAKRQRRRDSRDSSRRRPQILTEAEFLARRESVERVMAVRQRGDLAQVALLEDGILVEHFVSQTGSDSLIGSVFLGKVQNVLPSMEAAFVDIGRGRNAVIYAGEVNWDAAGLNGKARRIETALSSGDTILAQVSKDPVGHKGARLTTQISLPGRFVVYVPGGGATGISRKLPDTERKRLKSIMDRIVPEDAGVIIRTAAEGIAEDELARDVERLKAQWAEITRRAAEKTSAPTQLYAEPGTLIKVVRDLFNSDITRLVVDGDEAYEPVAEYVTAVAPELADRLVRWEGGGPDVFAAYRIDEQIAKALERKVHLPSGGSLVIDRTEAMTVVDVNTGKYTGSGGNLEETVTKNNLEAAEEMVRQLRLRDIGGIIVIDFIDMVLESNRELVLRRLTEALGRDRTRHQVAEVTSLGLVQMTRKRMGTGLIEAFSEPCPHCGGRGIVLHDMPMVATALQESPSERRAGKTRRTRGRDAERIDEIVVPRVVEQTPGRRPDPRGPKPPAFGNSGRSSDSDGGPTPGAEPNGTAGPVAFGSAPLRTDGPDARGSDSHGSGTDATEPRGHDGDDSHGPEPLHSIESAARAGIAAAAEADSDDFEAGQQGESQDQHSYPGGVGADEVVTPVEIVVALGSPANDLVGSDLVGSDLPDDAGRQEPADAEQVSSPEQQDPPGDAVEGVQRRRGRRSAVRPAGAPPAAQPVDIVVREPVQSPDVIEHSRTDDDAADGGHQSDDGHQSDSDANGNGQAAVDSAPSASETEVPAEPPRRRRAASRPAGPAGEGAAAEPMVMTVPAEEPAGHGAG